MATPGCPDDRLLANRLWRALSAQTGVWLLISETQIVSQPFSLGTAV